MAQPMEQSEDTTAFLTRVSGKVVYGAIVLEALLGALSDPLRSNPTIVLGLVLSLTVIMIAGAYSDAIGEHMKMRARTSWRDRLGLFTSRMRERSWIVAPVLVPVLFFGLAMLGVLGQKEAYALTRAALLGVLFFFGFVASRLGGATVPESLLSAVVVTLLGYVVSQAKILAKLVQSLGK